MSNNINFLGDNAISSIDDDLFNFKHYALKVQKFIQFNSSNPNPITIGIYGKWGEGKTSFLNLIEDQIDLYRKDSKNERGLLKYHFNPWRYSNEEEMLFDFFDGLAKTMFLKKETNLEKAGKGILRFSKYLKAIKLSASVGVSPSNKINVSFEPSEIFKAMGEDFASKGITLDILKNKVNEALSETRYKIIVFIDDIDRLDKDEIYTVLKLIKLNANFQNFIYITTLDSEQVAKAISNRYGDDMNDGKLFLEKIINLPIHLPRIESEDLIYFFEKKLDEVRKNLFFLDMRAKEDEFVKIREEFKSSFYKSPREILRVLNSFSLSVFAIGNEVNLRDLFFLETLKIRDENFYNDIKIYSQRIGMVMFQEVIDFNDTTNSEDGRSGQRIRYFKKYPDSFPIFRMLFPSNLPDIKFSRNKLNATILDSELKINSPEHFEKYFSFHTERKISHIDIIEIRKSIAENNEGLLSLQIKKLFKKDYEFKVLLKIENLIKTIDKIQGRDFYFKYLFENLDNIPDFDTGIFAGNSKNRIIETVALNINNLLIKSEKEEDDLNIEKLALELAGLLNIYQLCYFVRKFQKHLKLKEQLESLVVDLANSHKSNDWFFYEDAKNMPNKMIMSLWKKFHPKEFTAFMDRSLINEDRIKILTRNFAPYWNNEFFGGLDFENFSYMKQLLDIDSIFKKIEKFNPQIIEKVSSEDYAFTDKDMSTLDENYEQFIFLYKKDKV